MLVLARKERESVIITAPNGDRIKIFVDYIRGDKVRIGFEASDDYTIHREEVQREIDAAAKRKSDKAIDEAIKRSGI